MEEHYLTVINCPGCNEQLEELDVVCPWCGTKVREAARFSKEKDPRTREYRLIVEGAMAYAMTIIANSKRNGAMFPAAEALLARAKVALSEKEYSVALEMASRCGQEAEVVARQFDALLLRLGRAERKINIASEHGGNVEEALELLEKAKAEMEKGEYRNAIKFSMRSSANADKSRVMHDAWKVEVGDYL
ncbi:MAG: zinc ribbon domain-containing protein [Thermoplasmata archaeon]